MDGAAMNAPAIMNGWHGIDEIAGQMNWCGRADKPSKRKTQVRYFMEHHLREMELDGKIMTLDLQLQVR